jgi:hypothetical protein
MRQFLWGALSMSSAVVALLFLRYRHLSKDRLFGYFAAAFAVLALNWLLLALIAPHLEHRHLAYGLRLVSFVLILLGIVDKNVRGSPR